MNAEIIKTEIIRRMDEGEDPKIGNALSGLLAWIMGTEGTIEDLMLEAAILQDYGQIRQNIVEGINRFVCHHQKVGHFLTAVLSNDMREAFARADDDNRKTMFQIVSYCHNEIPGNCWGTPEKVKRWIEQGEGSTPHLTAPENPKEIERQDREGIWCVTHFKQEESAKQRRKHDETVGD